jgi:heme-degrading monooxygenase HmoA
MILEIADIRIKAGLQAEFEKSVQLGLNTVFPKAKGFRGHVIQHCIESPERYILILKWDTIEDHTVGFRGSPLFAEWRAYVADFFANPPHVEHFDLLAVSEATPW